MEGERRDALVLAEARQHVQRRAMPDEPQRSCTMLSQLLARCLIGDRAEVEQPQRHAGLAQLEVERRWIRQPTLDVGRMTEEEYVLARSVLIRVAELSSDARYHLCLRTADLLSRRFGTPRPQWLAPEPYLICIASAYQRRTGTFQKASAELHRGSFAFPPLRTP